MTPTTAPNSELGWRYTVPENRFSKVLLLHREGCIAIGAWEKGTGWIAWCPLPKRDKELEKRLGLRD